MLVGPSCPTSTPSSTSLALLYIYILNTYMEKYKAFVELFFCEAQTLTRCIMFIMSTNLRMMDCLLPR